MGDREIRDVLVFVYLDIHLAVCQNSKYTNLMQSIFIWNVCCYLYEIQALLSELRGQSLHTPVQTQFGV